MEIPKATELPEETVTRREDKVPEDTTKHLNPKPETNYIRGAVSENDQGGMIGSMMDEVANAGKGHVSLPDESINRW